MVVDSLLLLLPLCVCVGGGGGGAGSLFCSVALSVLSS